MKGGYKKGVVLLIAASLVFIACKDKNKNQKQEKMEMAKEAVQAPMKEVQGEWTILFDGNSFDGWHEYAKEGVSENWKLEDGAMVFYPPEDRKKGDIHDIVTDEEFTDFELSLEWKISEAGNSGFFWGIKEVASVKKPYHTGPEIQVLDNDKHPDGKNGTSHQAGALYDMVSPSKDVTMPVGEWNTMVIRVDHKTNTGNVHLNGTKITEFPVSNAEWDTMVSRSKFADWEHFGKYATGKIGLQDHGDIVAYKNIKIREL
ncbi:MAG: DUF1080 domain-containing protein [Bacteroidota bacterium]